MDTAIANWGVELAFIRTRVSQEFTVAAAFSSGPEAFPKYFTTYGHFDLVAVRCIDSLNDPFSVVLHRDVFESAPFRFFAERDTSREQFEAALCADPAALAVVAKIHPTFVKGDRGFARWQVSRMIREQFPHVFIFFGLGFSELLLIPTGNDLSILLAFVRDLRSLARDSGATILSKTTTFPFVSYALVQRDKRYNLLKGLVEPVVTVSCEPASERTIAQTLQSDGLSAKNIYGKNDLLIAWRQPIAFGDLAAFVTNLRHDWATVISRTTTYLENGVADKPIVSASEPIDEYEFMGNSEEKHLFDALGKITPHSLRAGISDLALRLSACLRSPLLSEYYRDMVNTFEFVEDLLTKLDGNKPRLTRTAGAQATRVADAARAAMNQRYAGLELHPETLAHSHSPLLCDIRSIVAAATCLPHYIFDNLFPGKRAAEIWPGFVLFGGAYSPQWFDQDVLALPPSSLLTPIGEWWKVTHEAAHAVYRLTDVDRHLPAKWRAHIESHCKGQMNPLQMIGEQFANWFDWNYIFRRDTELYLHMIWPAWLELQSVWRSKPQYLVRSFALLLAGDAEAIGSISKESKHTGAIPLIRERWSEFVRIVGQVPEMSGFIAEIKEQELKNTFELTYGLFPLIRWFEKEFEKACGVDGLTERFAPEYGNLDQHVQDLAAGKVILEQIPDPPRLHISLLRYLKNGPAPLAMEIAYIYSLENTYLLSRA
jgi:hypothetical protein